MADSKNEEYFDIPSVKRNTTQLPWQNINPSSSPHEMEQACVMNGHQNFNASARNNANVFSVKSSGNYQSSTDIQARPGVQTTTSYGQSGNLESWDPMGADFSSPTFNCYKKFDILASELPKQRSPQMSVKSEQKHSGPEDISLYVANIPVQMTQEGLRNLFQGAGKVHSCCVLPPKDPSMERKIGFVTFHSWKEASKAIECYDGFSLGGNMKLRVKVANKKGQRGADLLEKDEYSSSDDPTSDGPDSYGKPVSNGLNGSIENETEKNALGNNLLRNEPTAVGTTSPGTTTEARPCTVCQKLCTQRCSACKTPYCSRECQKVDRINHKAVCSYHINRKQVTPPASTVQQTANVDPVDDLDFDCIDISSDVNNRKVHPAEEAPAKEQTPHKELVNNMVNQYFSENHGASSRNIVRLSAPPTLVPGTLNLLVTSVCGGNSLWGQVVDNQDFLHLIESTKELEHIGEESLERVHQLMVGIHCLTRFSLDGRWYRSRVEQIMNDKVEVFFLDYGNKEWKQSHELYNLPERFSEMPAQARLFTLTSVVSSQNSEIQKELWSFLNGLISGRTLEAEVLSVSPGCDPEVVLKEPSYEKTINEMVRETQKDLESKLSTRPPGDVAQSCQSVAIPHDAVPRPPTPSTPSCDSGFKIYMAADIPYEALPPEKEIDIFVSDISSPSLFCIQFPATAIDKLNQLDVVLDATYRESPFLQYVPAVGELIVAKFTDGRWYRAKVDFIYNDGTLRVTFVDHGNSEDVRLMDVRRITQDLLRTPKLAVRCCLSAIQSPLKAGNWSPECINFCKTLMLSKRCTAVAEGHTQDTLMLTVKVCPNPPSGPVYTVNEELVKNGYAISTAQGLVQNEVKPDCGGVSQRVQSDKPSDPTSSCSDGACGPRARNEGQGSLQCGVESAKVPAINPSNPMIQQQAISPIVQHELHTGPPQPLPTTNFISRASTSRSNSPLSQDENYPSRSQLAPVPNPFDRDNAQVSHNPVSSEPQSPVSKFQHGPSIGNQPPRVLPSPNIPSGTFDVVVNDVLSADEFYAQMIDPRLVHVLQKCVRELNEFYKSSSQSPSGNVQIGSLGCARFSVDNIWYRAQVIAVEQNGYKVRFIDFGNTELVAQDAFRGPPEFFYQLAPQALSCRLAVLSEGAECWGEQSKEMLMKLTRNKRLSCTVVDMLSSPYVVKLEHLFGGQSVDIAKELERDLPSHPSSESNGSPRRASTSSGSSSRSALGEAVLGPAISGAGVGGAGDSCNLLVTDIAHPTYFWAQLAQRSNIEELNRLTEDLNAHYNNTNYPPFEPKVNMFCACKFSADHVWYRGFVKNECPKGLTVHFVDFGNSESTTPEMLRPLEEKFLVQPFRAMLCSLACIEPADGKFWSKGSIEYFKSKIAGKLLKCTIVYNSLSRLFLDIQDPESEDGQSVRTILLEKGMAEEVGGYSLSRTKESSSQDEYKLSGIASCSRFEEDSQFVNTPPLAGTTSSVVKSTASIIMHTSSPVGGPSPSVRGPSSAVGTPSPPVGIPSPSVGVPSPSVGVPSSSVGGPSPSIGDSSRFSGPFVGGPSSLVGDSSSVVVGPPSQVGERILNQAANLPDPSGKISYLNNPSTNGLGFSSQPDKIMASNFPSVAVDSQNPFPILVSEVTSPKEIYFQVAETDGLAALNALSQSLNTQFMNTSHAYVPVPGELCCALFSVDSCWYRVVICNVDITSRFAAVQFLDYGNRENVPFSSIRPIPPSFAELPFQARQACLAGVAIDDAAWAQDRVACLRKLLQEKVLMARVVEEVHGVLGMEFYDTSGDDDILVNALFVEQGYTVPQPQPEVVANSFVPTTIPEVIPMENELEVIVTEVAGPDCFWVQNIVPDTINQFANMTAHMNSICEGAHGGMSAVNVGDVCCSKFVQDGKWYRAKVEAFLQNGRVRAFYVDFGNREEVDPAGLKPLDPSFIHIPVQALQCTLANVQPTHGTWSGRAIDWLKSCIFGKRLIGRVVGRVGSVLQLELVDTTDQDRDVFINAEMVRMGEAKSV